MNIQGLSVARRAIGTAAAALAISLGAATVGPAAMAQIPAQLQGVDIGGPVTVPAGQTTTVDLGVPLNVNVSQNGWTVVSSGTSVSVTAPEGESSIAVPVSYGGRNATVTLISQPNGEVGIQNEDGTVESIDGTGGGTGQGTGEGGGAGSEGSGNAGAGEAGSNSGEDGGSNQYVAPRPPREPASPVDETEAEVIELAGEIDGNVLRSKMGLTQAVNVYNKFGGSDTEGLKLRYLDGDGQIIQGVQREIDTASRTLTLTYPEDQTPDNPFIIQVVRTADEKAVAVVRITSPGQLTTAQGGEAEIPQEAQDASSEDTKFIAIAVGILILVLLLIIGLIVALVKRSKRKKRQQ